MNPTLPIATRLRKLLRNRQFADEVEWLTQIGLLAKDAQIIAATVQSLNRLASSNSVARKPKATKVIKEIHGFGVQQRVVDWCHKHKITLPKKELWWWLDKGDTNTGYIKGLLMSRGYPRITNGIDVWIERPDGTLFKGHKDWLKWDRRPSDKPAAAPRKPKVTIELVELFE